MSKDVDMSAIAFPKEKDKPRKRAPAVQYTDEMLNEIGELMQSGYSYSKACEEIEVSQGSMWAYINRDAKRQEYYARVRLLQVAFKANVLENLTTETPDYAPDGKIDPGWVAYQRLKIDTAKWQLSKELPKVYGDKITQEVSGVNGAPIEQNVSINIEFKKPDES